MAAGLSERATLAHLNSAKTKLSNVLPPHADKIVRALQHVELALQYQTIDSASDKLVHATRIALRALNQIENQQDLPPSVRFAIAQATNELANIVRAVRAAIAAAAESAAPPAGKASKPAVRQNTTPDVNSDDPDSDADSQDLGETQLCDDDDTIDGLECLPDDFDCMSEPFFRPSHNPS